MLGLEREGIHSQAKRTYSNRLRVDKKKEHTAPDILCPAPPTPIPHLFAKLSFPPPMLATDSHHAILALFALRPKSSAAALPSQVRCQLMASRLADLHPNIPRQLERRAPSRLRRVEAEKNHSEKEVLEHIGCADV